MEVRILELENKVDMIIEALKMLKLKIEKIEEVKEVALKAEAEEEPLKETVKEVALKAEEEPLKEAVKEAVKAEAEEESLKEKKKEKKKEISTRVKCANLIKKELKNKFPGVKFSVISKNLSFNTSIDIYCDKSNINVMKNIEDVIGKYRYGYYDCFSESYNRNNIRDDIPQVDYIIVNDKST